MKIMLYNRTPGEMGPHRLVNMVHRSKKERFGQATGVCQAFVEKVDNDSESIRSVVGRRQTGKKNNNSIFFFLVFFLTLFYLFYLFMSVLDLRFRARAFSSCGERGPLFIAVRGASHYRGLSCCGA